jgi:rhamnulokinase
VNEGLLVAVDLGASSGRVIAGRLEDGRLVLDEVHRFPNHPAVSRDGLWWDIDGLGGEMLKGLRAAASIGRVLSVGIDTWGCDVGFLDVSGELVANPRHHRDPRNLAAADRVHERIDAAALYTRNGLQHLPFNTIFQIEAARGDPWFGKARSMLLIPDLLVHRLTGTIGAELTNASTTGLLDPRTRTWDGELAHLVGLDPAVLPPLRAPGTLPGGLGRAAASATGIAEGTPVVLVGSHDTASAVVAVPADRPRFAYISSGTWSLVGAELPHPNLADAGRLAGFTNEGGVDGTTRYLHNVMGLWLLSESLRTWAAEGRPQRLDELLAAAEAAPGGRTFDVDDPQFIAPGNMPARIAEVCAERGIELGSNPIEVTRAILDSLAAAYARTLDSLAGLIGWRPEVVHIVGGGCQNELLCRLTANATGLPVLAGPVEATATGNLLIQARTLGLVSGGLDALRALVATSQPVRRYEAI